MIGGSDDVLIAGRVSLTCERASEVFDMDMRDCMRVRDLIFMSSTSEKRLAVSDFLATWSREYGSMRLKMASCR